MTREKLRIGLFGYGCVGQGLHNIDNEYNGVITEAAFADKQFFSGKGAGGHATGSAVLSDIPAQ